MTSKFQIVPSVDGYRLRRDDGRLHRNAYTTRRSAEVARNKLDMGLIIFQGDCTVSQTLPCEGK